MDGGPVHSHALRGQQRLGDGRRRPVRVFVVKAEKLLQHTFRQSVGRRVSALVGQALQLTATLPIALQHAANLAHR